MYLSIARTRALSLFLSRARNSRWRSPGVSIAPVNTLIVALTTLTLVFQTSSSTLIRFVHAQAHDARLRLR